MNKLSGSDLQELVIAGLITPEQATDIEAYYGQKQSRHATNRLHIIFGVLGALLVSLAVILFIAHNWDEFNLLTKTIIGFLPLITGQLLCAYTLLAKKESNVWQEASAIVLFFAVAATISLISQVYHIDGTMGSFLMAWLLLTFPLVYIMRSFAVVLLSLSVATWYAMEVGYFVYSNREIPWLYLVILLLLAPVYYQYYRQNKYSNLIRLADCFLFVSAAICLGSFEGSNYLNEKMMMTGYIALFTLCYGLSKWKEPAAGTTAFTNPLRRLSTLSILILLMIWSFDNMWNNFSATREAATFISPYLCITFLLLIGCAVLLIRQLRSNIEDTDPIELSLYVFIIALIIGTKSIVTSTLLLNIWLLLIALWYIRKGNRQEHFGLLNFGLVIIATLAVVRFFDDDIPFIWRGFFFLITGAGFFAANYGLLQKKKKLNHEL